MTNQMTDSPATSYDTPATRRRALRALSHEARPASYQWCWMRFVDAAETCAALAAEDLLDGETERALEWAAAHRLLRERIARGHSEARRRKEAAA